MKKLLFSLFTFSLIVAVSFAQESDPKKALSKAGRALGAYKLDPAGNEAKLTEASKLIEVAAASETTNGQVKTWQTRGNIYNSLSDNDLAMLSLPDNSDYVPKYPDAPYTAAESFIKALELAEKKYEKKDALKGMADASKKLNQIGNDQIKRTDYAGAFKSLEMVLDINKIVTSNGQDAVIPKEDMNNHKFVLAYCAQAAGNNGKAKEYFKDMYDAGSDEAGVYAQYANLLMAEGDEDTALKILKEGMDKFSSNSEILFALINYYIQKQDFAQLEALLKKAIEAEPNNPSVYAALGNVYMNIFTEEFKKDRNSEQTQKYFDEALKYFEKALELDAKMYDAVYSIGSLYFNKAVELLKYGNTLDLKQQDEYNKVNEEANGLMEKALPYFKKAESMNANDSNTLIALSEIFARMNDFEKSSEFKSRLQIIKDGGENKSSYFND